MAMMGDHQLHIVWFFYPNKTRFAGVTNRHASDGKQNADHLF